MYTKEQALKIGGNEWKNRVYFNDLYQLYGLKINRYNSGSLSSATLNGEPISNSEANRICDRLSGLRVFLNTDDGNLYAQRGSRTTQDDLNVIIAALKTALLD